MKLYKKWVVISLSGCIVSTYGCTPNPESVKDKNYETSKYIEKLMNESKQIAPQYAKVKEKLEGNIELSDGDDFIVETYVTGLFYQSFPKYKKEVEAIFPKYYKVSANSAVNLISMPLSIDPDYRGDSIDDFEALTSKETYEWIMAKADSVESEISSIDKTSWDYKEVMYTVAECKRALYYRLGDVEKEKKYKALAKKYERFLLN